MTTPKTILITGSTDGLGLAAARILASEGHRVVVHGRNPEKLAKTQQALSALAGGRHIEGHVADLSRLSDVEALAREVIASHGRLDVLVNNAGVLKSADTRTGDGLDLRFAVNTIAPYLLTIRLLPLLDASGRVINLSSAAQAPVDLAALAGSVAVTDDFSAYAQSKLALTMWSRALAQSIGADGPAIIALNPGSMLGTRMVKEGFGVAGGDIGKGADVIARAALGDEFAGATGLYFDNDKARFADPHADALDPARSAEIIRVMDAVLAEVLADIEGDEGG